MRYLAIDLGDKRTGLATGDDETHLVGPLRVVEAAEPAALLDAVRQAIDEVGPDELVIGLPYNMDGTLGPRGKKAAALATLIATTTGLPVHTHDERLTSFDAEGRLSQSGLTRGQKKKLRDAVAAAAILRDFLDAHKPQ